MFSYLYVHEVPDPRGPLPVSKGPRSRPLAPTPQPNIPVVVKALRGHPGWSDLLTPTEDEHFYPFSSHL